VESADELAAGVSTSPEPVAASETASGDEVFRVVFFGAAGTFSALSTGDAEEEPDRG